MWLTFKGLIQYSPQQRISIKNSSFPFQCKPDFVIGDGFAVLDAKYKAILENRTDEDVVGRNIESLKLDDSVKEKAVLDVISKTIHADYYQIIAYSLLVTQWQNSEPASIACLVVPTLARNLDDNKILSDGLKMLSTREKIGEFKSWAKNQQKCPFFELPLEMERSNENREL